MDLTRADDVKGCSNLEKSASLDLTLSSSVDATSATLNGAELREVVWTYASSCSKPTSEWSFKVLAFRGALLTVWIGLSLRHRNLHARAMPRDTRKTAGLPVSHRLQDVRLSFQRLLAGHQRPLSQKSVCEKTSAGRLLSRFIDRTGAARSFREFRRMTPTYLSYQPACPDFAEDRKTRG